MTAPGIHCVCIDEHFHEMKQAGVFYNTAHVNTSPMDVALQLRMIKVALQTQRDAYTPWALKEEMKEHGTLKERTIEAVAAAFGFHDR